MRRPSRSSGDLIADRRYAYALELQKAGDITAAIELFEQAVERAPQWPAGWLALARARRDGFDQAGAIAAFRQCLHLDPADEGGASLDLARLDAAVTVDAAPAAYVAALFDAYAPDFDAALVERLGYSAPREIAARLKA
ncbi:MAG TPA: tetratricopeptide repeat protein, partial [Parvularculaceae bacterium]|nr:tetratricopeptide repeat protein [Parvularculaceae bacterium]